MDKYEILIRRKVKKKKPSTHDRGDGIKASSRPGTHDRHPNAGTGSRHRFGNEARVCTRPMKKPIGVVYGGTFPIDKPYSMRSNLLNETFI